MKIQSRKEREFSLCTLASQYYGEIVVMEIALVAAWEGKLKHHSVGDVKASPTRNERVKEDRAHVLVSLEANL